MVTSREFNTSRKAAGLPLVRFDLRKLSDQDILDLRQAYQALYDISETAPGDRRGYWAIAAGHGYTQDLCHIDANTFLPWHRAYIYVFEKMLSAALQAKRGDDGVLTLPYWNWTTTDPETDDVNGIPKVLTDADYVDPDDNQTKPNPLASARSRYRVEISNPDQPFTKRFVSPGFAQQIPGLAQQISNYLTLPQFQNFRVFQSVFDSGPHGAIHVWVGGLDDPDAPTEAGDMMQVVSAAYDPIFWLHHCMVDKVWYDWQKINGDTTVPGWIRFRGVYSVDNQPWTVEDTLDTEGLFNYQYGELPIGGNFPVVPTGDEEVPLPTTIPVDIGQAPAGATSAILEFHDMQPPKQSYELRVFVNTEEAPDASTPLTSEAGYAESIFFFGHGDCPGAPGHCNPNAEARDEYDQRGKHPLSRRNYTVDLTQTLTSLETGTQVRLWFVLIDGSGKSVPPSILDVESLSISAR